MAVKIVIQNAKQTHKFMVMDLLYACKNLNNFMHNQLCPVKVALKELKSPLCATKIRHSKKYRVTISKGTCA